MFQNKLSPIYRHLLPTNVLNIELPEERFADCDNCHHCQSDKNFRYETKCCDYHPKLPNYIVGAILNDESPELAEGKRRILEKIAHRKGVTPYGIIAPMDYHKKFQANRQNKKEAALQAEMTALKCPYLDGGRCSIYKYRSDICPVFYCMSSSGTKGSRFWNTAHQYMIAVERKLTLYAMQQQGYPLLKLQLGGIGPNTFKLESDKEEVKPKVYTNIWKEWEGKEIEFYTQCFKTVLEMNAVQVSELLGIEENLKGQQMAELATKMALIDIPDFLQLDKSHPLVAAMQHKEKVQLSDGKTIQIPQIQRMLLKSFNGRTSTLSIVQKGNLVKKNLSHLLVPLMKEGVLKKC